MASNWFLDSTTSLRDIDTELPSQHSFGSQQIALLFRYLNQKIRLQKAIDPELSFLELNLQSANAALLYNPLHLAYKISVR